MGDGRLLNLEIIKSCVTRYICSRNASKAENARIGRKEREDCLNKSKCAFSEYIEVEYHEIATRFSAHLRITFGPGFWAIAKELKLVGNGVDEH